MKSPRSAPQDKIERSVTFTGFRNNRLSGSLYFGASPHIGCVLVHGLRTDRREFGSFPQMMADAGISALSFDLSGHGESAGVRSLITRQSHAADCAAAIEHLRVSSNVERVLVMGHSFGAHAALRCIDQGQADGAILIAPQRRSGDGKKVMQRMFLRVLGPAAKVIPSAIQVSIPMKKDYTSNHFDTAAAETAAAFDWDPGHLHAATLAYAASADNISLYKRTSSPILIVHCENDRKVPASAHDAFKASKQRINSQFLKLSQAGHSPFLEKSAGSLVDGISSFSEQFFSS